MGHAPHDHAHHHAEAGLNPRRLLLRLLAALIVTAGFVGFEVFYGLRSNSLALISDAMHNLTDALALLISSLALGVSARPSHARKTFGYHRAGILAALFNSVTLLGMAAWIAYESVGRIEVPPDVDSETLMGVSGLALVVNGFTAWLVGHGAHDDLNLRSAFLHLVGDVLSNLGALAAGLGIYFAGAQWLDPAASLLIALLILWNAWLIVAETIDILMEGSPRDIPMDAVIAMLLSEEEILGLHNLHVWSLSKSLRFLTAHLEVREMSLKEAEAIRQGLAQRLQDAFAIEHVTLQMELSPACAPTLYCRLGASKTSGRNARLSPSVDSGLHTGTEAAKSCKQQGNEDQREQG